MQWDRKMEQQSWVLPEAARRDDDSCLMIRFKFNSFLKQTDIQRTSNYDSGSGYIEISTEIFLDISYRVYSWMH